jgi:hypothetical protein
MGKKAKEESSIVTRKELKTTSKSTGKIKEKGRVQ